MENLVENQKIKGVIEFWKTGENPITCYDSFKTTEIDAVPKKQNRRRLQPVLVVDPHEKEYPFESVVLAAIFLEISLSKLYSILNGNSKNFTTYKISKITLNN
jgi:hypothetical protein